MKFQELVKNRRSVRRFVKKDVDNLALTPIIESALWAPSAGNIQDKEFVIIRKPLIKKALAEACFRQVWIADAPVIIVLLSNISKLNRFGSRAEFYATISAGAAIQNMLLSLADSGLQGTGVGLFDEQAVKRVLKIPPDRKVFAVIPLGKPGERLPAPKRINIKALTFFEEHGRTWVADKPKIVFEK